MLEHNKYIYKLDNGRLPERNNHHSWPRIFGYIYMCRNTDVSVLQKCLKLNTAVNDGMYSVDPAGAQGDWCCTSKGSTWYQKLPAETDTIRYEKLF